MQQALPMKVVEYTCFVSGYANELGESFKAFLPKSAYIGSYVISSGYVMADAYDKGLREHKVSVWH